MSEPDSPVRALPCKSSAIETCSPVERSTSISRASGSPQMPPQDLRGDRCYPHGGYNHNGFVCHCCTQRGHAQRRDESDPATRPDVPPYFWTIRGTTRFTRQDVRVPKPSTLASAASSAAGFVPPACAMSARPPPRPPTCCATPPMRSPALIFCVWSAVTPATNNTLSRPFDRSEHDHRGLRFVLQLIDLASRNARASARVDSRREHFHTVDFARGTRKITALPAREFALELLDFLFQPLRPLKKLPRSCP